MVKDTRSPRISLAPENAASVLAPPRAAGRSERRAAEPSRNDAFHHVVPHRIGDRAASFGGFVVASPSSMSKTVAPETAARSAATTRAANARRGAP